ncbi:MAG: FAD-binding protein, partial [Bacillota bacterium]
MEQFKEIQDLENIQVEYLETDFLIIGAGNAGCFAAIEAKRKAPELDVMLMEKAYIDRSGCLAGGMDAINTYIKKGRTLEEFIKWSRSQAGGIIREDLAIKVAENLNKPVEEWEEWGLPIKKDEDTEEYKTRGKWDITIQGESMKPIIAEKVRELGCKVLNRVVATNYILQDGIVKGAMGFGLRDGKMYVVKA